MSQQAHGGDQAGALEGLALLRAAVERAAAAEARMDESAGARLAIFEARVAATGEAAGARVAALRAQAESVLLGVQEAVERVLRVAEERVRELEARAALAAERAALPDRELELKPAAEGTMAAGERGAGQ